MEKLIVEEISFYETYWKSETVFRPLEPLKEMITGEFGLLNSAKVKVELSTTDIIALEFNTVTLSVALNYLTLLSEWNNEFEETWYWVKVPFTLGLMELECQTALTKGQGLTDLLLKTTFQLDEQSSFRLLALFSNGPPLEFELVEFALEGQVGSVDLSANATLKAFALQKVNFNVTVEF